MGIAQPMKVGSVMYVQLAAGTAFVVMLWAAWPSRRVREGGRKAAVGLLCLGLLSTIMSGLAQLIRPELSNWVHHPAVRGWVADRLTEIHQVPSTVWLSLGIGTIFVASLQSLYRLVPPEGEVKQLRHPNTPQTSPTLAPSQRAAQAGRSELQRALDAMSQAHESSPPAGRHQRRVEDLLPPR